MIWIGNTLVSEGQGGVYGERLINGYREWSPKRSKLAALYHTGRGIELERRHRVLYLGAANGTTVSHVADYVEVVYAVESAPRPMQDLLVIANKRENIIPIMADARRPESYRPIVEKVDIIYQDIAQPDQIAILLSNATFLLPDGSIILMLKPRCIDITRSSDELAVSARDSLIEGGLFPHECIWLSPHYPDHAAFICSPVRK